MPSYDALKSKQTELIRKATDGSVFIAPISSAPIGALTTADAGGAIDLSPLPAGYSDLGYMTEDGASFGRDVATSDITSWGSSTPTRSDITADTTTVGVTAQETNIFTIGLATGRDMTTVVPDPATGEVRLNKPAAPSQRFYRLLTLAVDRGDAGEIYIARFFPRAKVTAFGDQAFGGGDAPIEWGVTMTGFMDTEEGYSESWLFGGPGWRALLDEMGFAPTAP